MNKSNIKNMNKDHTKISNMDKSNIKNKKYLYINILIATLVVFMLCNSDILNILSTYIKGDILSMLSIVLGFCFLNIVSLKFEYNLYMYIAIVILYLLAWLNLPEYTDYFTPSKSLGVLIISVSVPLIYAVVIFFKRKNI